MQLEPDGEATSHSGYIAMSYNHGDSECAFALVRALSNQGIECWALPFLPNGSPPLDSSHERRYDYEANWLAAYLDRAGKARGFLILSSWEADISRSTPGRGMWFEQNIIRFFRENDAARVREVSAMCPPGPPRPISYVEDAMAQDRHPDYNAWLRDETAKRRKERECLFHEWAEKTAADLAPWGRQVCQMVPIVINQEIGMPTGEPIHYPFSSTFIGNWYTIARIDLYDRQWFCRRCGTRSDVYSGHNDLPSSCPSCSFRGSTE